MIAQWEKTRHAHLGCNYQKFLESTQQFFRVKRGPQQLRLDVQSAPRKLYKEGLCSGELGEDRQRTRDLISITSVRNKS